MEYLTTSQQMAQATLMEAFEEYIDGIYFEGYFDTARNEDPEKLRFEFQQFKEYHS